ncbi:uncharacterized protein LOC135835307 [Planococcus citri]|uniref:uncharacterized protein LOC135835307 n=1 Tax=Planococcus citri TaxID=170843 RepID=UPI0031FA1D61
MKEIPIYSFCYDSIKKKTLFTNHGIIFPELLHSKALNLERNIQYQMAMIEEYAPSNLIELEAAMMAEAQEGFHLHLIDLNKRPNYKAAKFVPSEDKPFALWIKSTHQYFNVELQHEVLIPLWDELSHHIRLDAKTKWIRYCITTGVFDLTSYSRTDNQLTNVWVKMVYEVSNMPWENPSHAMVILMDNFIDFTTPSDEEENEMKEYCEKNLCIDDLKERFKRVGGRVRCCSLTAKMRELLGMELQDTTSSMPVLLIPGINDEVAESSSSFKNILN